MTEESQTFSVEAIIVILILFIYITTSHLIEMKKVRN